MIKSYENFVNEGFLENIWDGIEAGIGAFKANRNAEKALDKEKQKAFYSGSHEYSDESKMTLLVKHLVRRAAILADNYSWDKILEDDYSVTVMEERIKTIEGILSEMKELLVANK